MAFCVVSVGLSIAECQLSKSKKCNHRISGMDAFARFCADGSLYSPTVGSPDATCWRCLKCGEYASLGKANDEDPNVRLEIMAAERLCSHDN